MATIFEGVSAASPQRSTFDLSHDRKYTMEGGKLTPIFCKEVVPGDKFSIQTSSIVRLIPMVGPTMHKIDMDIHFFYVPNRILWKNWERFITGSRLAGADAGTVPVHPYLDIVEISNIHGVFFKTGSLADYLGYPVVNSSDYNYQAATKPIKVNSLPFRAMSLIWKEYYRDQNLQTFDTGWDELFENDGNDIDPWVYNSELASYFLTMLPRAWEKDYFTSCLPFVQKGDPLTIPLGSTANLIADNEMRFTKNPGSTGAIPGDTKIDGAGVGVFMDSASNPLEYVSGLQVDLSGATAATINDLRAAFQAQLWLERNARTGTRYIESLEAHFGVRPADYRLQRPELFGASRMPIQISEVLQTSETANSPQGNMAGHGIGFDKASFNVFCPEHGWIIGIASIKPRTSYMYAVPKQVFRLDYLDYYWPEFARLGEQAVLRKELGWNQAIATADIDMMEQTFGYQSRYAEYRSAFSTVHGGMREDPILSNWHMARRNVEFHSTLSPSFVIADPTTNIFADTQADYQYIVHTNFNVRAKRPMPFFSDPGYIDHP